MALTQAPPTNNLVVIRKARGMTAAELARRIGQSPSTVCHVERGDYKPWPAFRRQAAAVLGVDEALLFGDRP